MHPTATVATLLSRRVMAGVNHSMEKIMPACYMCEREGTTTEHVPPKCIFPEQKDLPEGMDLRKQLITVPACDLHNTKKSKDDEYILYALVMNLPANEFGKNQFLKKLMRAIERNPKLINQFLKNHKRVTTHDTKKDKWQKTIAVEMDIQRFKSAISMISRALYFHHYGEKWLGKVSVYAEFLISLDPYSAIGTNATIENMAKAVDIFFKDESYLGENPDIFKYQIVDGNDRCEKIFRLYFYGSCKINVIFGAHG